MKELRKEYNTPERITGLECESKKCQNKKAEKEFVKRIARGPDILLIHFNRFKAGHRGVAKNNSNVPCREILDLSEFVEGKRYLKYRLLAAVLHWGSLREGHYISVTRTPNGSWEMQNDMEVSKTNVNVALNPGDGWTPYMLFYERILGAPAAAIPATKTSNKRRSSDPPASSVLPPKRPDKRVREEEEQRLDDQARIEGSHARSPKRVKIKSEPRDEEQRPPGNGVNRRVATNMQLRIQQLEKQVASQSDLINRAATAHIDLVQTVERLETAYAGAKFEKQKLKQSPRKQAEAKRYSVIGTQARNDAWNWFGPSMVLKKLCWPSAVDFPNPSKRYRKWALDAKDAEENGELEQWLRDHLDKLQDE